MAKLSDWCLPHDGGQNSLGYPDSRLRLFLSEASQYLLVKLVSFLVGEAVVT